MKKLMAMLLTLALLMPAACAVTKEEIAGELGVFRLDELEHVANIEVLPDGECPRYVLTMEDGIIAGGTEVSSDKWFTSEGVMCQADIDMDGDGTGEYVVAYAHRNPDLWPEPELRLRVYACEAGDYVLKGDLPLIWYYDNATFRSWVRIVPLGSGAAIFTGGITEADGGVDSTAVLVYGYDGESCVLELHGSTSNIGNCLLHKDVGLPGPECVLSCYELTAAITTEEEMAENEFAYTYPPVEEAGLKKLNEALAEFGVEIQYTLVLPEEDPSVIPCLNIETITGGRDFQTTSSDEDYQTLTLGMTGLPDGAVGEAEDWIPELSEDPDHQIVPDSDERELTKEELSVCDLELLGYIRNEILARHGYPFQTEKYREYFGGKSWYTENPEFVYDMLSALEMANVETIKSLE